MRIAQFIDTDGQGGAETMVLDLCRSLRDRGADVVLLHFESDFLRDRCRRFGLDEVSVPHRQLYKSLRRLPLFWARFARFLRAEGVELLHSHLYGPVTGAAPAALLAGVPHVGTLHDVYVVAERPARIRLLQLAALCGTRLVAVSQDMERFYRQRARFSPNALRTIYNGIAAHAADRLPPTRGGLGIGSQDLIILCVGRLVPLKQHRDLLQAFSRLRASAPLRLVLAGDGPLRRELSEEAHRLGIADRVHLLGNREDVPALLAASDIFALASATEGLSCSVLEAMSAGLPIVVTRVGGNPELVVDGESGFLVEPGDADALGERLQRLVDSSELRQELGRRALQRARSAFSPETMIDNYLRLYAELAPGSAVAAGQRE